MRSTFIAFVVSIFLLPLTVQASPMKWLRSVSVNKKQLTVAYQSDNVWVVDVYEFTRGELQKRLQQKRFLSKTGWTQYLDAHLDKSWKASPSLLSNDFTVTTEVQDSAIWTPEHQWDKDWEKRYSDWVEEEVDRHFFENHNLATDCADVAFALRWIFARIHKLPAGNRLAGSRVLFTHQSMKRRWSGLPTHSKWWKDRRFREALDYLLDNTYTHSLVEDSYPVEVSDKTFLAGGWHLKIRDVSGHTYFFHRVNEGDVALKSIYSTVPREVREMAVTEYWISRPPESESKGGLLRMRWPVKNRQGRWMLVSDPNMPHFSKEQYQDDFMDGFRYFYQAVTARLSPGYGAIEQLQGLTDEIQSQYQARVQVVEEGHEYCQSHDCAPGTEGWVNWSTPSRDGRILGLIEQAETLIVDQRGSNHYRRLREIWSDFQWYNYIEYRPQQSVPMDWLIDQHKAGNCSHDPRDSVRKRWCSPRRRGRSD